MDMEFNSELAHFNAVTKSFYGSSNQEHLQDHSDLFGFNSPQWAGFHQWKEIGRKVRKGAKACKIYMVCSKNVEGETAQGSNQDAEKNKRKVLKGLSVFNFEHTEPITEE